jgi:hypothetical protein
MGNYGSAELRPTSTFSSIIRPFNPSIDIFVVGIRDANDPGAPFSLQPPQGPARSGAVGCQHPAPVPAGW